MFFTVGPTLNMKNIHIRDSGHSLHVEVELQADGNVQRDTGFLRRHRQGHEWNEVFPLVCGGTGGQFFIFCK